MMIRPALLQPPYMLIVDVFFFLNLMVYLEELVVKAPFLEAQLLSNYIDVTDSLPYSQDVYLFRPYHCCLWTDLEVLYVMATLTLTRKQFMMVRGVKSFCGSD